MIPGLIGTALCSLLIIIIALPLILPLLGLGVLEKMDR
jgi:hypothetical protein